MNEAGWRPAEESELLNHRSNGSYEWVDASSVPAGRKLVKMTWVYKTKRSGKLKARLCVQGCSQIPGVDYDQTHCSTMRSGSLRMLSALAAEHGLLMRRWDFVSAYLQGELLDGEVVYCSAPPGHPQTDADGAPVVGSDGRAQVVKVVKPIYGMAQAGRRWQRTLYPWLLEQLGDNAQLHSNNNVFSVTRENMVNGARRTERLIVGCYVDDLFILSSHRDAGSLYDQFTSALQARWQVDDEGDVSDLLGIEISASSGHVQLKQTQYIEKMASEWFKDGVPSTVQSNKAPADVTLPQEVCDALCDVSVRDASAVRSYQSLVGALLYAAMNTRPDVAYSVGMLCRAMSKPTPELFAAALRVLGYLYRTRDIGLRYEHDGKPPRGMSDSDWATHRSTTGWVFIYNSAAISWSSRKQDSIALSSCEAEIMAASEASKEALHVQRFAQELGIPDVEPLELAVDNTGARDLAYNPEHHQRVKHIERRHFFIRECVENMKLTVPYVATVDNLADFFTKPLTSHTFFRMRDAIMNVPSCHRASPGSLVQSPGGSGK